MAKISRTKARQKKHLRVRSKISGTATTPRLNVFKSLKNIEVQLIDDTKGVTLASSSSRSMKIENGGNIEAAKLVGKDMGAKIVALKIKGLVFDRGGYLYHGRVQALADAVRGEGVKF
ncbi:MAG: 50S ribosomal protein L18 [Mycoplasmataceae bacterium]|nr:50S ribosomal protein L18 [Mycoplasmataceae bacterium]